MNIIHPNLDVTALNKELASIDKGLSILTYDVINGYKRQLNEQLYVTSVVNDHATRGTFGNTFVFLSNGEGVPFFRLSHGPVVDDWEGAPEFTYKVSSASFNAVFKKRSSRGGTELIQSEKPSYVTKQLLKACKSEFTGSFSNYIKMKWTEQLERVLSNVVLDLDGKYFDVSSETFNMRFLSVYYLIKSFQDKSFSDINVPDAQLQDIKKIASYSADRMKMYEKYLEEYYTIFNRPKFFIQFITSSFTNEGIVQDCQTYVRVQMIKATQDSLGGLSHKIEYLTPACIRPDIEDHYLDPVYGDNLKSAMCFFLATRPSEKQDFVFNPTLGSIFMPNGVRQSNSPRITQIMLLDAE